MSSEFPLCVCACTLCVWSQHAWLYAGPPLDFLQRMENLIWLPSTISENKRPLKGRPFFTMQFGLSKMLCVFTYEWCLRHEEILLLRHAVRKIHESPGRLPPWSPQTCILPGKLWQGEATLWQVCPRVGPWSNCSKPEVHRHYFPALQI